MSAVDLLLLGDSDAAVAWSLGEVRKTAAEPAAVDAALRPILTGGAQAVLFWDARLGPPPAELARRTLERPEDLWHAGLRLGLAGQPGLIDFVHPTWMHNRDPDPDLDATSWRLSLRACLVRAEVLRRLGGPRPAYETLDAAGLELGHRWLSRGALPRHLPALLPAPRKLAETLPLADAARFVYHRAGRRWTFWALARTVMSGAAGPRQALAAWRAATGDPRPPQPPPFRPLADEAAAQGGTVTVLIPTLDRYPYLRVLLDQLRRQTHPPCEILVVDQTLPEHRAGGLEEEFADLPLSVIHRDAAGQCSSRNAGILAARGDFILFLDDDDEVEDDLIARHLATLDRFSAGVSSGVAEEVGAGPLPEDFTLLRASNVFPTNNTLLRREVLAGSGLFDLAYEHGERADGDLGMRVYLSGARMILNPAISVLHHHAPRGGLRQHRARVETYASSRRRLAHRHLPSATEIYLARRYFSHRQVREMLWMRAAGTLLVAGSPSRRLLKLALGLVLLPNTLLRIRRRTAQADAMLRDYPQIERLTAADGGGSEPAQDG